MTGLSIASRLDALIAAATAAGSARSTCRYCRWQVVSRACCINSASACRPGRVSAVPRSMVRCAVVASNTTEMLAAALESGSAAATRPGPSCSSAMACVDSLIDGTRATGGAGGLALDRDGQSAHCGDAHVLHQCSVARQHAGSPDRVQVGHVAVWAPAAVNSPNSHRAQRHHHHTEAPMDVMWRISKMAEPSAPRRREASGGSSPSSTSQSAAAWVTARSQAS